MGWKHQLVNPPNLLLSFQGVCPAPPYVGYRQPQEMSIQVDPKVAILLLAPSSDTKPLGCYLLQEKHKKSLKQCV